MARVLVVEDNPLLQKMYLSILAHNGYEVEIAGDGLEGLEKAKKLIPDLILMDIMMPKLSGIKVLEQLRANPVTAKIQVVILTNLANEADAVRAKELGAVKFLIKADNDPSQITAMVEQLLPKQ